MKSLIRYLVRKGDIEMDSFSIGSLYEINGLKTVDINLLPENYCGFDCVFVLWEEQ